ncbi:hypothetical protein CLU79DRAFT_706558 [Phycomyces nitens]|nr:hypothetical protein CLU79DRAFT_706558 [Phycomyces nitens]
MRYACIRVLAGPILLNGSTGKALLVNCIAMFGQRRTLDAHRESFRSKNGKSKCTSVPPKDMKYKNVYSTTIITSILRLYAPFNPKDVPSGMSFYLNDSSKAKATTIFVEESAWKEVAEIAQDNNAAYTCSL